MKIPWRDSEVDGASDGIENPNCLEKAQRKSYISAYSVTNVKKRRNTFDFTGCLGHAKVTRAIDMRAILRVRGYMEHNADCQRAVIQRMPEQHVHPSLCEGVPLEEVRHRNRELFAARGYKDMPQDFGTSPYRWLQQQKDFRSRYRQYSCVWSQYSITLQDIPKTSALKPVLQPRTCSGLLGSKRDGGVFSALVTITDTDLIEQAALLNVFPHIWLLLCRFHLWQSWRNHNFGRHVVAKILKCPVDGILWTTNHFESFNGLLKNKHLCRWQKGGHQLCVDVLIRALAMTILPSIFEQRCMWVDERARLDRMICALPDGARMLEGRQAASQSTLYCYLEEDALRDAAAKTLVDNRQIGMPVWNEGENSLRMECYSSMAFEGETNPIKYWLWLGFDGGAQCSCRLPDTGRGLQTSSRISLPNIALADKWNPCINRKSPQDLQGPMEKAAQHVDDLYTDMDEFFEAPVQANVSVIRSACDDLDSDASSIATDASDSDDEDQLDGGGMNVVDMKLRLISQQGLEEQSLIQVLHEVEKTDLPKQETYLHTNSIIPSPHLPRTDALIQGLTSLTCRLTVLAESSRTSDTLDKKT
ncbi:hypothetical protein EDD85DRAFT_793307 [Armillaria nabsnona]|nr:hypothetical protein EDD85DRAFT_793307 [Armillaria nabsnona]